MPVSCPVHHHHCLFNAIDSVGDANTAESCKITAITSVEECQKCWLACSHKTGQASWSERARYGGADQDGDHSVFAL